MLPDHRFGTMKNRTDGLTSKGETTTVAVSRDETTTSVIYYGGDLRPSHTHRHRAVALVAWTTRPSKLRPVTEWSGSRCFGRVARVTGNVAITAPAAMSPNRRRLEFD